MPRPLATHTAHQPHLGNLHMSRGAINLITVNEAEEVVEEKKERERERRGGCTSIRLFATPHALRIEWALERVQRTVD